MRGNEPFLPGADTSQSVKDHFSKAGEWFTPSLPDKLQKFQSFRKTWDARELMWKITQGKKQFVNFEGRGLFIPSFYFGK